MAALSWAPNYQPAWRGRHSVQRLLGIGTLLPKQFGALLLQQKGDPGSGDDHDDLGQKPAATELNSIVRTRVAPRLFGLEEQLVKVSIKQELAGRNLHTTKCVAILARRKERANGTHETRPTMRIMFWFYSYFLQVRCPTQWSAPGASRR